MSDPKEMPGAHHLRPPPGETFASSEGLRRENQELREALRTIRMRFRLGGVRGGWEQELVDICTLALGDGGDDMPRAALRGTMP